MLWSLLSSVYPKSRTLQCLMLCEWGAAQEAGRKHSQENRPKLSKGIVRTMFRKLGELPVRGWSLLGEGLGIDQQVRNCTMHHLFSWVFYLLSFLLQLLLLLSLELLVLLYVTFFNYLTSDLNPWVLLVFPWFSSSHWEWVVEWATGVWYSVFSGG